MEWCFFFSAQQLRNHVILIVNQNLRRVLKLCHLKRNAPSTLMWDWESNVIEGPRSRSINCHYCGFGFSHYFIDEVWFLQQYHFHNTCTLNLPFFCNCNSTHFTVVKKQQLVLPLSLFNVARLLSRDIPHPATDILHVRHVPAGLLMKGYR